MSQKTAEVEKAMVTGSGLSGGVVILHREAAPAVCKIV